jgi:hypothetical protein
MTRVIDGGRTRSRVANAPGVIGPSLASVDRADSCERETGGIRTPEPQLASQTDHCQRQVARQPGVDVLSRSKDYIGHLRKDAVIG